MSKTTIILLALLEGFTVLSVEILGAKMLTPFYGASIFIWTMVLGITLISLTSGYYLGSFLSRKSRLDKTLYLLLQFSALLILLLPFILHPLLQFTKNLNIYTGAFIATVLILSPGLTIISSTNPILIQLLTEKIDHSGKQSGWIYAWSTVGGIFASFFFSFYLISAWGITLPCLISGLIILIASNILLFEKNRLLPLTVGLLIYIFTFIFVSGKNTNTETPDFKIHYRNEGIFGQLTVMERLKDEGNPGFFPHKTLMINGIPQSLIFNNNYLVSIWKYPHVLSIYSSMKPAGSSALVLGLGAGAVTTELNRLGFTTDVVDIDKRMLPVAKNYFSFNDSKTSFITDDARHFIKRCSKKYDVIIIDVVTGETQPSHIFTLESFTEIRKLLRGNAMLLINFQGCIQCETNAAVRSIYSTLQKSGLKTYIWAGELNKIGDIFFIASPAEIDFTVLRKERLNECCKMHGDIDFFIKNPVTKLPDSYLYTDIIFRDDQPMLDIINARTIIEWRQKMIKVYAFLQMKEGVNLFK